MTARPAGTYPCDVDLEWRAIAQDDVPAWAQLLAAAEVVDRTGEHYDEADLGEELATPGTAPDHRAGAWLAGRMIAYAGIMDRGRSDDFQRVHAEGVVHPDHRGQGLGSHGLQWIVTRSTRLCATRSPALEGKIHLHGFDDNTAQAQLFEHEGFAAVNWSALMRVHLDGRQDPPGPLPSAMRVRTYDRDWSSLTRDAHNSAFADHWGFVPWSEEMWRQWVDDTKNARHDMSWVVVSEDEPETVAGYVLSSEFGAFHAATGRREAYLGKIGVRREYRGRGVASWLLRHALAEYTRAGYDESSLDVDTNNPTGAFGLYERAGYGIDRRTTTYERILPATAELTR